MAIVIASPRAESWGVAGLVRPGALRVLHPRQNTGENKSCRAWLAMAPNPSFGLARFGKAAYALVCGDVISSSCHLQETTLEGGTDGFEASVRRASAGGARAPAQQLRRRRLVDSRRRARAPSYFTIFTSGDVHGRPRTSHRRSFRESRLCRRAQFIHGETLETRPRQRCSMISVSGRIRGDCGCTR